MTFRADLHCHSTWSDGTLTPCELVKLARERGLSALSITDHDTLKAYETAFAEAKEAGLILGTGVEFSCEHQKKSVHVLGYDYPYPCPELENFCQKHIERRVLRNRKILENLAHLKMPIEEKELQEFKGTIGRPHLAFLMIRKGYVATIKEAFNLYLGEGKCCYERGEAFSVLETIEIIHQSGGKAFIAHPQLIEGALFLKEILSLPFDGIECYYAQSFPGREKKWLDIAKTKGWLISGGSDFHGQAAPLGCSWVGEEAFYKIFSRCPIKN